MIKNYKQKIIIAALIINIIVGSVVYAVEDPGIEPSTNDIPELDDIVFEPGEIIRDKDVEETKEMKFTDVTESNWFYPYLLESYQMNIISGFLDNTFRGQSILTRDQFIKMLVVAVCPGHKPVSKKVYWFDPYLEYAKMIGIEVKNRNLDEYKENISREEASYYTYMALNVGKDMKYVAEDMTIQDPATLTIITDKDAINQEYKNAINVMYDREVLSGYADGTFKPKSTLTRAEATVIISKLRFERAKDIASDKTILDNIVGYAAN